MLITFSCISYTNVNKILHNFEQIPDRILGKNHMNGIRELSSNKKSTTHVGMILTSILKGRTSTLIYKDRNKDNSQRNT